MAKAWESQKELKKEEIPSPEALYKVISGINSPRDKTLAALLYLTAGRISEVLAIKREDIKETSKRDRPILLVRIPNRKNKERTTKSIPIPLDKPIEKDLAYIILYYIKDFQDQDRIFNFSSIERGWQIIKKELGFNPHWLRHIRLTHLIIIYDFPTEMLVRFAGWTSISPAKHYIELRWTDFLDKI